MSDCGKMRGVSDEELVDALQAYPRSMAKGDRAEVLRRLHERQALAAEAQRNCETMAMATTCLGLLGLSGIGGPEAVERRWRFVIEAVREADGKEAKCE